MEILASQGARHLIGKLPAQSGLLVDLSDQTTSQVTVHSILARGYWDDPTTIQETAQRALELASNASLSFTESRQSALRHLREASSALQKQQLGWAREIGKRPSDKGHVPRWQDNILSPQPEAIKQYEEGDGHELHDRIRDGRTQPAKMRAVHSSSALAWNFFGYFQKAGADGLTNGLQLPADPGRIAFEWKVPSVVGGKAHNLDLAFLPATGSSQPVLAIESKFCEPYGGAKRPLRDAYYPPAPAVSPWVTHRLHKAAALTDQLRSGAVQFVSVDATQLLKHLLGLAAKYQERPWRLLYLYYDVDGKGSEIHTAELARFQDLLGEPGRFSAMSYQGLYPSLLSSGSPDYRQWRTYMENRYLNRPGIAGGSNG